MATSGMPEATMHPRFMGKAGYMEARGIGSTWQWTFGGCTAAGIVAVSECRETREVPGACLQTHRGGILGVTKGGREIGQASRERGWVSSGQGLVSTACIRTRRAPASSAVSALGSRGAQALLVSRPHLFAAYANADVTDSGRRPHRSSRGCASLDLTRRRYSFRTSVCAHRRLPTVSWGVDIRLDLLDPPFFNTKIARYYHGGPDAAVHRRLVRGSHSTAKVSFVLDLRSRG
ncbi:hypothetical protein B0H13DRAFT_1870381 [Mycena leptocephala]|nr:hypothetical protein B0H13DRAFT_1870381 [Mycena leptocephala]